MKGLIRKEWYSLWSQYRIHMLAMLGLGVLLPIIKNTDFFPDESFWIYWAVITIFYILMHSVEYEKKSNWDMYRATFPINGREIVVSKYIFGFGIVIIASILVFAGSMICQKMIVGRINIYFIGRDIGIFFFKFFDHLIDHLIAITIWNIPLVSCKHSKS